MEPERVGDIVGLTCMGNEGAQWIGMAPFVERDHLVQNLGDGTFFHSGSLAIRAAVAAGIDITYKLLYNGTVAMTGGQDPQGADRRARRSATMLAGRGRRAGSSSPPTTPARFDGDFGTCPAGVEVWDRSRLDEAQVELADDPGRHRADPRPALRRREAPRPQPRHDRPRPGFRVVINERICEGCGDCGDKSQLPVGAADRHAVRPQDRASTRPAATSTSRACRATARRSPPSRSTPRPKAPSRRTAPTGDPSRRAARARHAVVDTDRFTVRLSGIGGTGVITVSQISARPRCSTASTCVASTRPACRRRPARSSATCASAAATYRPSNHANAAGVDCFLAFDMLGGGQRHPPRGRRHRVARSWSARSTSTPTGAMVVHPTTIAYPEHDGPAPAARRGVAARRTTATSTPRRSPRGLFGAPTTANILLLGVAVQAGALAVDPASHRAGDRAQRRRRRPQHRGVPVRPAVGRSTPTTSKRAAGHARRRASETLDQLIERLADDLVDYQDARLRTPLPRLGRRGPTGRAERRPDRPRFTEAVARHLHKLMAYKDEYEVARLLLARVRAVATRRSAGRTRRSPGTCTRRCCGRSASTQKIKFRRTARAVVHGPAGDRSGCGAPSPTRSAGPRCASVERAMIPEYERALDDARRTPRRRQPRRGRRDRRRSPTRSAATSTSSSPGPPPTGPSWPTG